MNRQSKIFSQQQRLAHSLQLCLFPVHFVDFPLEPLSGHVPLQLHRNGQQSIFRREQFLNQSELPHLFEAEPQSNSTLPRSLSLSLSLSQSTNPFNFARTAGASKSSSITRRISEFPFQSATASTFNPAPGPRSTESKC